VSEENEGSESGPEGIGAGADPAAMALAKAELAKVSGHV
jgi:hypothetical protein